MVPDEPATVRLMNTIWADTAGVHDDLTTPDALRNWLTAVAGRDTGIPNRAEFTEARLLRDSLRRLAAFCTDDSRPAAQSPVDGADEAITAVNKAAADRPIDQLVLHRGRLGKEPSRTSSRTRAALAELAHEAIDLLTGADATRLRACHAPGCVLYFVRTHPRREWCSEACGNRARAARHYQRDRERKARQTGGVSPNSGGGR